MFSNIFRKCQILSRSAEMLQSLAKNAKFTEISGISGRFRELFVFLSSFHYFNRILSAYTVPSAAFNNACQKSLNPPK